VNGSCAIIRSMAKRLPLSALLSFALVAFTIETDTETERRIPHRTARYGASAGGGPWLISMAMWFNCLRWVPEQGITVREVERLARTRTNWDGMRRWGHIYFEPSPDDARPKPPLSAMIVRVTVKGKVGQQAWGVLVPMIEGCWRERFGVKAIEELRSALIAIADRLERDLPDCLPILKYGLFSEGSKPDKAGSGPTGIESLPLPALLARVLLAFAMEYERESAVSLAISANILRVIEDGGASVRELPALSGVSKEAVAMALSFLAKQGSVAQSELPGSKVKSVRLTAKGIQAQAAYGKVAAMIERRWNETFGSGALEELRSSLEALTADGTAERSPLFACLQPSAECWRAKVPKPATLPHYPMVLHRGGYPDGS